MSWFSVLLFIKSSGIFYLSHSHTCCGPKPNRVMRKSTDYFTLNCWLKKLINCEVHKIRGQKTQKNSQKADENQINCEFSQSRLICSYNSYRNTNNIAIRLTWNEFSLFLLYFMFHHLNFLTNPLIKIHENRGYITWINIQKDSK